MIVFWSISNAVPFVSILYLDMNTILNVFRYNKRTVVEARKERENDFIKLVRVIGLFIVRKIIKNVIRIRIFGRLFLKFDASSGET